MTDHRESRRAPARPAAAAILSLPALLILLVTLLSTGAPPMADEAPVAEPGEDADPAPVAIGERLFLNPDFPQPQASLLPVLCASAGPPCKPRLLLDHAIARFKTPGLRDLGHSGPYFHDGGTDTIEATVAFYARVSDLARAGQLRNAAPELSGIALGAADQAALAAFLASLNEDYE